MSEDGSSCDDGSSHKGSLTPSSQLPDDMQHDAKLQHVSSSSAQPIPQPLQPGLSVLTRTPSTPAPGSPCGSQAVDYLLKFEFQMYKVRDDEYAMDMQVRLSTTVSPVHVTVVYGLCWSIARSSWRGCCASPACMCSCAPCHLSCCTTQDEQFHIPISLPHILAEWTACCKHLSLQMHQSSAAVKQESHSVSTLLLCCSVWRVTC